MPLDSDVALLGTGVAPLVAAAELLAQGKTVLLLNPDWDYFLEDSELSFDPFFPIQRGGIDPRRLRKSLPEPMLEALRPGFPGAVEHWSGIPSQPGTFRDPSAPHVRNRARLWLTTGEMGDLEDLYVRASDADLNPQILEGLQVSSRFPGASRGESGLKGVLIPKLCDVDVMRYRNGLLEFVRERIGPERALCGIGQLENMPGGIRFHAKGGPQTARLQHGMLVFWTPKLTNWVLKEAKRLEVAPRLPLGVRLWEQWSLISREKLDPSVVGTFGEMAVWAELEGAPSLEPSSRPHNRMGLLRSGPLVPLDSLYSAREGMSWASVDSFDALSRLFHGFLKWDYFSVREMKPRALFEWGVETHWLLSKSEPRVEVLSGGDGPLMDVVRRARGASLSIISEAQG